MKHYQAQSLHRPINFFSFLIVIFIIYLCEGMCVPMWVCECKCRYPQVPEALDSLELGLPEVGTGEQQNLGPLKEQKVFFALLSHPISPGTLVLNNENLFPKENR